MPTPVVHDPRQNRHGWWGTLVFVDDQDQSKIAPSVNGDSGVQHIFVKTSRESHIVSQGTVVQIASLGDAPDAMIRRLRNRKMNEAVVGMIERDLANLDTNLKQRFHEIRAIDNGRTSPLTRMQNIVTEVCFRNEHWLSSAGDIGQDAIEKGLELPPMKELPPVEKEVAPATH